MKKLNIALLLAVLVMAVYLSVLSPAAMQSLQAGFLSFLAPFLRTGTAVREQIGSMGKGLKTLDEVEAAIARMDRSGSFMSTGKSCHHHRLKISPVGLDGCCW